MPGRRGRGGRALSRGPGVSVPGASEQPSSRPCSKWVYVERHRLNLGASQGSLFAPWALWGAEGGKGTDRLTCLPGL